MEGKSILRIGDDHNCDDCGAHEAGECPMNTEVKDYLNKAADWEEANTEKIAGVVDVLSDTVKTLMMFEALGNPVIHLLLSEEMLSSGVSLLADEIMLLTLYEWEKQTTVKSNTEVTAVFAIDEYVMKNISILKDLLSEPHFQNSEWVSSFNSQVNQLKSLPVLIE